MKPNTDFAYCGTFGKFRQQCKKCKRNMSLYKPIPEDNYWRIAISLEPTTCASFVNLKGEKMKYTDLPVSAKAKHQGRTIIYETPNGKRYHYFKGQATPSFSFWLHIIIDTAEAVTCRMPDVPAKSVSTVMPIGKLIDKLPDNALRLLKNHLEGKYK